ncbi:hypothetical protein DFH07DRAFT_777946 [Mycena maculata]|uniref:Uncharacterized protein n=1 Tax=Mycena maculata TaxID=230809 RepID=A0AAD7IHI1_9AGAR|nr:hypothetical protein DFH07DRAFT_777946 [Mycena maculata]
MIGPKSDLRHGNFTPRGDVQEGRIRRAKDGQLAFTKDQRGSEKLKDDTQIDCCPCCELLLSRAGNRTATKESSAGLGVPASGNHRHSSWNGENPDSVLLVRIERFTMASENQGWRSWFWQRSGQGPGETQSIFSSEDGDAWEHIPYTDTISVGFFWVADRGRIGLKCVTGFPISRAVSPKFTIPQTSGARRRMNGPCGVWTDFSQGRSVRPQFEARNVPRDGKRRSAVE